MLGTVESDLLFEAVDIVAENDARGALLFVDRLAARGRDFGQFAQELIGHLRNIFLHPADGGRAGRHHQPVRTKTSCASGARPASCRLRQVLRFIELLTRGHFLDETGKRPAAAAGAGVYHA